MRASISFPGRVRSVETKDLATEASRHAAHSKAEPRASSKNLARCRPWRLPLRSPKSFSCSLSIFALGWGVVASIAVAEQTRAKAAKGSRWCDSRKSMTIGERRGKAGRLTYFFLESEIYFGCWTNLR